MSRTNEILFKFKDALKKGKVVDFGSGDGTNIAFLRENGFTVEGVEKNYGTTIEDYINSQDKGVIDNIISFYTLHFLKASDASNTYSWMKDHTDSGGLNIIIDFTTEGEWNMSEIKGFYLKPKELKEKYQDWEILHYDEKPVPTYNGSQQIAAFIVAKKP